MFLVPKLLGDFDFSPSSNIWSN